jgi:hypothetical protein
MIYDENIVSGSSTIEFNSNMFSNQSNIQNIAHDNHNTTEIDV